MMQEQASRIKNLSHFLMLHDEVHTERMIRGRESVTKNMVAEGFLRGSQAPVIKSNAS